MKNLMQKVYKTMVFETILQKGIEKINRFLNCSILRFDSIYKTVIFLQNLFALLENIIKFP